MAEYIEREEMLSDFSDCNKNSTKWTVQRVSALIYRQPAADVAPVVHARWGTGRFNLETGNYEEQCTRCRNFSKEYDKPYCPNCGAKMDIEDGGATNAAD